MNQPPIHQTHPEIAWANTFTLL